MFKKITPFVFVFLRREAHKKFSPAFYKRRQSPEAEPLVARRSERNTPAPQARFKSFRPTAPRRARNPPRKLLKLMTVVFYQKLMVPASHGLHRNLLLRKRLSEKSCEAGTITFRLKTVKTSYQEVP